jgi:germination protein M
MKNKKLLCLLVVVLSIIVVLIFYIVKNFNVKNDEITKEYIPEEEISDNQLRETIVSLYFLDIDSQTLKTEGKLVDSASLVQNPYKELINLLIQGPKSQNLIGIFPDNTQILDAYIKNNCVTVDFSQELLNFENEEQKYNIVNSILNTLAQLNEVNSIEFLINNEKNDVFSDTYTH